MPRYVLVYFDLDVPVGPEVYSDLDNARDAAWSYSAESGLEVTIYEEFGFSRNHIETINAN